MIKTENKILRICKIVCEFLIKKGKLPFIVGGGNDLTYALYKAYANLNRFITLTCIDSDFNLGLEGDVISSESFLERYYLINQTIYFNLII